MTADDAATASDTSREHAAEAAGLRVLEASLRLELPPVATERTFRRALAGVALVYALLFSLLIFTSAGDPPDPRGQVDGPPSIVAEIVEEPAPDAKSKLSQSGTDVPLQPTIMDTPQPPAPPPMPPAPEVAEQPPVETAAPPPPPAAQPPQPDKPAESAPPPAAEPLPEEPAEEPLPEPKQPERKPEDTKKPSPPEPKQAEAAKPKDVVDPRFADVDVTMDRYAAAVDAAIAERKRAQQQQQARASQPPSPDMSIPGSNMKIRGAAKSGRNDEYSRSVIAALLKTKPKPFAIRGSVLVSFEIGPGGALKYVKLLDSSHNSAMDQVAISAIRRAVFGPPPANATSADLTYIINYIFD